MAAETANQGFCGLKAEHGSKNREERKQASPMTRNSGFVMLSWSLTACPARITFCLKTVYR